MEQDLTLYNLHTIGSSTNHRSCALTPDVSHSPSKCPWLCYASTGPAKIENSHAKAWAAGAPRGSTILSHASQYRNWGRYSQGLPAASPCRRHHGRHTRTWSRVQNRMLGRPDSYCTVLLSHMATSCQIFLGQTLLIHPHPSPSPLSGIISST